MNRTWEPGVAMRASAYEAGGDRLGVLPDVLEMTVTVPRNKDATLNLTYVPRGAGIRGDLLDREVEIAIEQTFDGESWTEMPGARFLTTKSEWNLRDDGTSSRSVQAIHVGSYLKEAFFWEVPTAAQDSDGKWKFLSKNAGQMLRTIWDGAVARGWGKGLTLDCTTTHDSANAAWKTITTLYFEASISISQVLESLTSLGMIDWAWEGRTLRVYNADTSQARDLHEQVRWPLATTLTSAPETRTWEDLCTDVLVRGESNRFWRIHNDQAPQGLRRIEKVVEAGGVELEATARLVAEATLKSGSTPGDEIKREWDARDVHLLPWQDYRIGDWISVEREGGMERCQVVQISMTQKDGFVVGHTTFGTVLDSILGRLTKRTKGIVGLASTATGTRPSQPTSKYWPLPPQGLVASSRAYIRDDGYPAAMVALQWGKVETDTLGVRVEVTGYEIAWGPKGSSAWSTVTVQGQTTQAEVGPMACNIPVQLWVRASTQDGYGAWSNVCEVRTASDATPPPVPSAPTLGQTLGVLNVYWDGKGAQGESMPTDYAGVEVSVNVPGRPAIVFTNMPAPMQRTALAGLEIRDWEVCLRTFDRVGNRSEWSKTATITLEQNIDADAIVKKVEDKLAGSDAMQKAAREGTLKEMKHLTEAMTQVATSLVESGPYPPDSGKIGSSIWVSPTGEPYVLRAEGDK